MWLRNAKVFQALGTDATLGQEEEGQIAFPRCLPPTGRPLITTAVKARQPCEKNTKYHQGIPTAEKHVQWNRLGMGLWLCHLPALGLGPMNVSEALFQQL